MISMKIPFQIRWYLLFVAIVAQLIVACGGTLQSNLRDTSDPTETVQTPSDTETGLNRTISITSPLDQHNVGEDGFTVTIALENLILDESLSDPNTDGVGRWKLFCNGTLLGAPTNQNNTLVTPGDFGTYTLKVEFVNTDGTSYSPPIMSEEITVTGYASCP